MSRAFILLLTLVQLSGSQAIWTLRTSVDLTHPIHPASTLTPTYESWNNRLSLGADLDITLTQPFFMSFSVDFTDRHFASFPYPYPWYADPSLTEHTHGGDGSIWRLGVAGKLRQSLAPFLSLYAQAGLAFTFMMYDDVYYSTPHYTFEDTGYLEEHRALNPSTVFAGGALRLGLEAPVSRQLGFSAGIAAYQNQVQGFYYQTTLGVFAGW